MNRSTILSSKIEKALEEKRASNNYRKCTLTDSCSEELINLASNDYLNLTKHPKVLEEAQRALALYGTSSSGSPVVASYLEPHKALECKLSEWIGFKECMLWASGFSANESIMKLLPQKGDIVLADRYVHYSLIKGILESNARLIRYNHCDIDHIESLLKKHQYCQGDIYLVTESLYSMDGDYPDLGSIAKFKENYPFIWILDEAHAIGWYGPKGNGLAAHYGVTDSVDILIATLGKSLAGQGAFSLFHDKKIKEYLINYSKEFLYSTYPAPCIVVASKTAIEVIGEDIIKDQAQWHQMSLDLREELKAFYPELIINESPIIPLIVGDCTETLRIASELLKNNIVVGAIRPPSVPAGTSRLRLSLNKDVSAQSLFQKLKVHFP